MKCNHALDIIEGNWHCSPLTQNGPVHLRHAVTLAYFQRRQLFSWNSLVLWVEIKPVERKRIPVHILEFQLGAPLAVNAARLIVTCPSTITTPNGAATTAVDHRHWGCWTAAAKSCYRQKVQTECPCVQISLRIMCEWCSFKNNKFNFSQENWMTFKIFSPSIWSVYLFIYWRSACGLGWIWTLPSQHSNDPPAHLFEMLCLNYISGMGFSMPFQPVIK